MTIVNVLSYSLEYIQARLDIADKADFSMNYDCKISFHFCQKLKNKAQEKEMKKEIKEEY